jgi:hypothetical protein
MPRRAVVRDISCESDFDPPQKCFSLSTLHSFFFSLSFIDNNRKKRSEKTRTEENIVAYRKKCNDKSILFAAAAALNSAG